MVVFAALVVFPPIAVPLYLLVYPLLPLDAELVVAPLGPALLTAGLCLARRCRSPRVLLLGVATAVLSVAALYVALMISSVTCENCIT